MTVAIYARVSTNRQDNINQVAELEEYCKRNNRAVFRTYKDEVSGVKDTRPELDKLMQDARLKRFNQVIIWKVDRLGRNPLHMLQIVEEWEKIGIDFTVTTLGIDTSTPMGKFVFGLLAQVVELERRFIIERTNTTMSRIKKELTKKGYYITKEGKRITKLGRPKGKGDSKPRKKRGYYLRDYKKRSPPHFSKSKTRDNEG